MQFARSWISVNHPDATRRILEGERAVRFVAGLNEIEPQTDFQADGVTIFTKPDVPSTILILSEGVCVVAKVTLPIGDTNRLLSETQK